MTPYEILGVSKDAKMDNIKNAYRSLVKKLHPDHFPDDHEKHKQFDMVKEAYEILKDPLKRAEYDKYGEVKSQNPQLIREVVDIFMQSALDPRHSDPLKSTRNSIQGSINGLIISKDQKSEQIKKIEKVVSRIKGEGPFVEAVKSCVHELKSQLTMIDKQIDTKNWQLEFLESYDFDSDEIKFITGFRCSVGPVGFGGGGI